MGNTHSTQSTGRKSIHRRRVSSKIHKAHQRRPLSIFLRLNSRKMRGEARHTVSEESMEEIMHTGTQSTRRRTRSMTQAQHDDDEEDSGPITSRRIRRRIKGKARQTEDNESISHDSSLSSDRKGKVKQTESLEEQDCNTCHSTSGGQSNQCVNGCTEEDAPQQHNRIIPPLLDPISSRSTQSEGSGDPLRGHTTTTSENLLTPNEPTAELLQPTAEGRLRIRAQIAQALGVGVGAQLASSQSPLSNQPQPSMLSALLNDILGLRSGRTFAGGVPNDERRTGRSVSGDGAPHSSREMMPPSTRSATGGTTVIVQGALISATLPSRREGESNEGMESRSHEVGASMGTEAASRLRRSQSQPPVSSGTGRSTTESVAVGTPASDLASETQLATIEEQAAMLSRLLSIATAATAASLISRPARQNLSDNGMGLVSSEGGLPSTSVSSPGRTAAEEHSSPNPIASGATGHATSTSSSGFPWRSASHPYQSWRERLSALRNRFRFRTPTQSDEEVSASQTGPQIAAERVEAEVSTREPALAAEGQDGDPSASLSSLSTMLQDAIRQGVQGTGDGGGQNNTEATSTGIEASNRARNVHATLDAVRQGQLSRGEEGSFDRFLFDLLADLDVAVRRLPEEGVLSAALEGDFSGHRRHRDLHDGQLSFFRQFTFPATLPSDLSGLQTSPTESLLPCVVVGVRSLGANETWHGDRAGGRSSPRNIVESTDVPTALPTSASSTLSASPEHTEMRDHPSMDTTTESITGGHGHPRSRFLLFVSGGHYPPHHPLFHSTADEASRDLMILMEFLSAMASMHTKPSTVTVEQIEKSKLHSIEGGVQEIAELVNQGKIRENTSERCLICLEEWADNPEHRRLLDCAHLFHAPCIDQWLIGSNNSCPLCRRRAVDLDVVTGVGDQQSDAGFSPSGPMPFGAPHVP